MRFLRSAVAELVGLFVSDWVETLVILVILLAAWILFRGHHATWPGFAVAGALGLQLVLMTARETRRRSGVKEKPGGVGDAAHDHAGEGHLEPGGPPGPQGEERLGGAHEEVRHQ